MDITTKSNFILIQSGIFKNNNIFLWLKSKFDNFAIRFKKPDIFNKVIFLYFMRIITSSNLDNNSVSLFFIERYMTRFLFGNSPQRRYFLDICRRFYKTFLFFSTMRTNPGFIDIFKDGSLSDIFFSNKRIINVRTSSTGEFLHKFK